MISRQYRRHRAGNGVVGFVNADDAALAGRWTRLGGARLALIHL